jgi:hypothetical protein
MKMSTEKNEWTEKSLARTAAPASGRAVGFGALSRVPYRVISSPSISTMAPCTLILEGAAAAETHRSGTERNEGQRVRSGHRKTGGRRQQRARRSAREGDGGRCALHCWLHPHPSHRAFVRPLCARVVVLHDRLMALMSAACDWTNTG